MEKPDAEASETPANSRIASVPPILASSAGTQWGGESYSRTASSMPTTHESRYAQRTVLGRGGMAEVRLVSDATIGRDVAFKVLAADLARSIDARERFLREVRVQGGLEHPSIVPVYDAGIDAAGNYFFTMKRITGATLESILRALADGDAETTARWTLAKLLGVFRHVCMAVDYAHSRGVVHRDLKPANVMVGDFGEVYVLDWGVAKVVGEGDPQSTGFSAGPYTQYGAVLGTPGYMAPEQLDGAANADQRSDVYSLGAILFELLTLQPLHTAKTSGGILRSTRGGADARARERAPARDVPPELEAMCVRATAQNSADRFSRVHELTVAVERYAEGDRDLEMRRRLALQHSEAAEAATRHALAGGPSATAERARALAEAGRALALDPNAPGALGTVVTLLQVPPDELPPEVEHANSEEVRRVWVSSARDAAFIYGGFLVLCAVLLWLGVRSWLWLAAIAVPLALSFFGCAHAAWVKGKSNTARILRMPIIVATGCAVAAVSGVGGPLAIGPTLAVALAAGGGLWVAPGLQRYVNLSVYVLALTVPMLLEWTGVLPRSYVFHDGAITVLPVVTALPELPARIGLMLASIGALVGATLFVYRSTDMLTAMRLRLALQSWHLRQLAAVRETRASDGAPREAEET